MATTRGLRRGLLFLAGLCLWASAVMAADEPPKPGAAAPAADAQPKPVAWELKFENDIAWYKQTSIGILIASTGTKLHGVDGLSGRILWERPIAADRNAVVEVFKTHILVVLQGKEPNGPEIALALDQFSGEILWRGAKPITDPPTLAVPFYDQHLFLVATQKALDAEKMAKDTGKRALAMFTGFGGKPAKPTGNTFCIDLLSGSRSWERKIYDPENIEYRLHSTALLEQNPDDLKGVELKSGSERWKQSVESKAIEVAGNILYLGGKKVEAFRLDTEAKKLQRIWAVSTPNAVDEVHKLIFSDGALYLSGEDGVARLESSEGKVVWARKLTKGLTSFVGLTQGTLALSPDKTMILVNSDLRTTVLRAADGAILGDIGISAKADESSKDSNAPMCGWYDSKRIFVRGYGTQAMYEIQSGSVREMWKHAVPKEVEYPEVKDAKAMQTGLGILTSLAGAAAISVAGDVTSDLGKQTSTRHHRRGGHRRRTCDDRRPG